MGGLRGKGPDKKDGMHMTGGRYIREVILDKPVGEGSYLYDLPAGMLEALTNRVLDVWVHTIPVEEGEQTPISSPEDDSLTEIKTELAVNQKVLTFGCAFISDGADGDLYTRSTDGRLVRKAFRYEPDRKQGGGHALTIVGYDDTLECDIDGDGRIANWERGAFKVANSWGKGWQTDGGFFWLPYDALNARSNSKREPASHISAFSAVLDGRVYSTYEYYSMDVVSCEPDMVAELQITRGKQGSDVWMALGTGGSDGDCPEENIFSGYNLCMGGGEIEDYRVYLDFTPGMAGDASRWTKNRWWFFYSGEDTVSASYRLQYFEEAAGDHDAPALAAGDFLLEGGRDNGCWLDFSLQYTGGGPDPVDSVHRWVVVSPGTTGEALLRSLPGGSLSLKGDVEQGVPTGARLIQRYRDQAFGFYTTLLYGDLNGDGRVDQTDLALLVAYLDGKTELYPVFLEAAHVFDYLNGTDTDMATIRDAIALRGYIGTLGARRCFWATWTTMGRWRSRI